MAQPLEVENLSYNAPGGAVYGATSTDKVGFWGVIPVARPVTISTNNVSTTVGISTSSASVAVTTWGFASQVEATNAITAVSTMQAAMKALGLIAGGVDTLLNRTNTPFEVVDYGGPDGAVLNKASSRPLGFYGATPVARDSVVTGDISTATTVSASTNGVATTTWGWSTSSEFAMITSAVSTMQLAMKRLGLIA